jgi:hypothetical protein
MVDAAGTILSSDICLKRGRSLASIVQQTSHSGGRRPAKRVGEARRGFGDGVQV